MALTTKGAGELSLERRRPSTPLADRRLSQLATRGDPSAFAAIFQRHHQELYRYCRAILGNADEAEDALQSTMVKALRALPGESREIALKPWLFRVAHNEAIGLLRARRAPAELDAEQVDARGGVAEAAETRERLRHLVGDLRHLPERQRGALIMRELNGNSFAEIGASFGISEAAAKQTVYEARSSLHVMNEGREMACDPVREAISGEDRRRLRSRRIRAHLRECDGCRGFEAAIAGRRADLAVLAPPLAVPAALATLHAVLGAGAGGTTAAGGAVGTAAAGGGGAAAGAVATGSGSVGAGAAAGGALGAGAAAKSVAAVLATITIAGGAAKVGGVVDLGGSDRGGDGTASPSAGAREAAGNQRHLGTTADTAASRPSVPPAAPPARGQSGDGQPRADRNRSGSGSHRSNRGNRKHAGDDPPGQSQTPPGQAHTPPGQAQVPPGQEQTPPGQADPPPGQPETPPGQSQTPPGQSQTPPGQSQTPPGQSQASPGQTSTLPRPSHTPPEHSSAPEVAPEATEPAAGSPGTSGTGSANGHAASTEKSK